MANITSSECHNGQLDGGVDLCRIDRFNCAQGWYEAVIDGMQRLVIQFARTVIENGPDNSTTVRHLKDCARAPTTCGFLNDTVANFVGQIVGGQIDCRFQTASWHDAYYAVRLNGVSQEFCGVAMSEIRLDFESACYRWSLLETILYALTAVAVIGALATAYLCKKTNKCRNPENLYTLFNDCKRKFGLGRAAPAAQAPAVMQH